MTAQRSRLIRASAGRALHNVAIKRLVCWYRLYAALLLCALIISLTVVLTVLHVYARGYHRRAIVKTPIKMTQIIYIIAFASSFFFVFSAFSSQTVLLQDPLLRAVYAREATIYQINVSRFFCFFEMVEMEMWVLKERKRGWMETPV